MKNVSIRAISALFCCLLAPLVVQAQAGDPVKVTQDDAMFYLDNGIIRAMISKKSGDIISMKFKGAEMFATVMNEDGTPNFQYDPPGNPGRGRGMTDHMYGFWSHDTVADRNETKITLDTPERGEVSVKGFSDGKKLGHGPGAGPDGNFAADIEIRYALGRGETGIYTYCIFDHKPEYPDATMGEARFCAKLNESFDWMLVNEQHNYTYPRELEAAGDNKYNYTTVQWENPAFGWASTTKNVGFFIVNASMEYMTGQPTKVEFLCHRDTSGPAYAPTVLNYWRSSHYGGGSVDVAKGEAWTKVVGPIMLYANTGNSPQIIWADALAQQKREAAKWPYEWVNSADYPKKDQRSTVKGQMVLSDPQMPTAKSFSNLRVGMAAPDYKIPVDRPGDVNSPINVTWATDSKHYSFWARGDANGEFSIPAVRAGKYTFHAFADGVFGEFAKADVTIEAGKPLDLGKLTWTPVRKGKQLWEIGIPNRTGAEFVKGQDHFHDGMATVYALLFPNDVNYEIGKSEFAKDWYYLHVPHASDGALAAATVNAQPPAPRGRGRGIGGPATQQSATITLPDGSTAAVTINPATQPGRFPGARAGGRGAATQPGAIARGVRGAAPAGGAGGGGRPSPWKITFDLPSAPKGKATLRVGVATNNNANVAIAANGQQVGQLSGMLSESSIGRNANRGIWFEKEVAFDASTLKAGRNDVTLTLSSGGIIYDYLRLELDENAAPTAMAK